MFNSKQKISKLNIQLVNVNSSNESLSYSNEVLRSENKALKAENNKLVSADFKYKVIKKLLDDDELILSVFDSELITSILMDIKKGTDPKSSNSHFYWSINQQAQNIMKIYEDK